MRPASFALVLSAVLVISCSRNRAEPTTETSISARPSAPAEPETITSPPEFGPIIGETLPLSTPAAGRYSGSGEYSQQKFITRERTTASGVQSRTVIELLEGGELTACFAGKKDDHSSVSKYASDDGKDHTYEQGSRWLLGARGSWSIAGGRARLLLTEVRQGTCTPDVPQTGFELPFELTCLLLGPGEKLPGKIMACRLDKAPDWLKPAGLDLGKSAVAGPWSLRFTTMRAVDSGGSSGPWLLLGAGKGVHVTSVDGRRDPTPTLTLTEGAREFVEDDWKNLPPGEEATPRSR